MTSGTLNRRINIQTQSSVQDDYGAPTDVWTNSYSCWASIDVQNSQLIYNTAEFMEKVAYRIEIRWTSSFIFKPNQRIVYTEPTTGVVHTYNIEAVLNDKNQNKKLILMAYELDGDE